ncbi:unnamed protein product [Allacma fusca]|uniref:Reverse transcriptase/retrotransposon-derived protein RNase H-like domain-containing protein n=1 Tax=Allacma fusca TaxID=39272 RepID=A0A8J2PGJ4_9HEXA|nr:unnamed protein product [Allacma fusca]
MFQEIADDHPRVTFHKQIAYEFLRTETVESNKKGWFIQPEESPNGEVMPIEATFHYCQEYDRYYPDMAMYPIVMDLLCKILLDVDDSGEEMPKTGSLLKEPISYVRENKFSECCTQKTQDKIQLNRNMMKTLVAVLAQKVDIDPATGEYMRREFRSQENGKAEFVRITYDPPTKSAQLSKPYNTETAMKPKSKKHILEEQKQIEDDDKTDIENEIKTFEVKSLNMNGTIPPDKIVHYDYYEYDSILGMKKIKIDNLGNREIYEDKASQMRPNDRLNEAILMMPDIMDLNDVQLSFVDNLKDDPWIKISKYEPDEDEEHPNQIKKIELTLEQKALDILEFMKTNESEARHETNLQRPTINTEDYYCAIPIFIDNVPIPAQLDTGALPNAMTKPVVDYLTREHPQWIKYIKLDHPVNLKLADNKIIRAMTHIVEVCVRIGNHMLTMPFFILDTDGYSVIIGRLSLRYLGIKIDCENGQERAICNPKNGIPFTIPFLTEDERFELTPRFGYGSLPLKNMMVCPQNVHSTVRMIKNHTQYLDEDWAHEQEKARELYKKNMKIDLNNLVVKGWITLEEANNAWKELEEYCDIFSFNAGKSAKDGKILWGPAQEEAFEKLKTEFCADFTLKPPPPDVELYLDTYVSEDAMNAVLFYITNKDKDDEQKHICLFVSIAFEAHQKNFTPFDKDMMALVQEIDRMEKDDKLHSYIDQRKMIDKIKDFLNKHKHDDQKSSTTDSEEDMLERIQGIPLATDAEKKIFHEGSKMVIKKLIDVAREQRLQLRNKKKLEAQLQPKQTQNEEKESTQDKNSTDESTGAQKARKLRKKLYKKRKQEKSDNEAKKAEIKKKKRVKLAANFTNQPPKTDDELKNKEVKNPTKKEIKLPTTTQNPGTQNPQPSTSGIKLRRSERMAAYRQRMGPTKPKKLKKTLNVIDVDAIDVVDYTDGEYINYFAPDPCELIKDETEMSSDESELDNSSDDGQSIIMSLTDDDDVDQLKTEQEKVYDASSDSSSESDSKDKTKKHSKNAELKKISILKRPSQQEIENMIKRDLDFEPTEVYDKANEAEKHKIKQKFIENYSNLSKKMRPKLNICVSKIVGDASVKKYLRDQVQLEKLKKKENHEKLRQDMAERREKRITLEKAKKKLNDLRKNDAT